MIYIHNCYSKYNITIGFHIPEQYTCSPQALCRCNMHYLYKSDIDLMDVRIGLSCYLWHTAMHADNIIYYSCLLII